MFAFLGAHPRRTLLLVCAALIVVLWLLQLTPYLNVANDAGRYMVLGESLARTGDLRLLNDVRQPLDTLYPPGFPAIIAFWMRVTGRNAMGVVLPVKATQLFLLLGTLPLLYALLERAHLSFRYIAATLTAYAVCPALISYANEVMSEMPLLFLCLASVVAAEGKGKREKEKEETQEIEDEKESNFSLFPLPFSLLFALLCAAGAFLIRTSGIALLLAQIAWFWRRYGWKWGLVALLVTTVVVGGWLRRNSHIIKAHPEIHYATYVDQFTLRDPMKDGAGRIPLNVRGLLSRMKFGFPTYIGLVPRALLYMMAPPRTLWLALFYLLAVPLFLLMLVGLREAWRRGLKLSCGFAVLFWLVAALWPWQNARFLVPLLPFMFLFLFLGVEKISARVSERLEPQHLRAWQITGATLLLTYFVHIHYRVIRQERRATAPGYAFGRSKEEAGFYAACEWLRSHANPHDIVMGKPQYLLHLYAGSLTVQLEPTTSARSLENAYIVPQHVRYLLQDQWSWGVPPSRKIFGPYLLAYGDEWDLAWSDPRGSGVRVWRRIK